MNLKAIIICIVCMSALVACSSLGPTLTETELINENKACNENRLLGKDGCIEANNCCYMEKYNERYDTHIPLCIGVNVYRQVTLNDEEAYLKKLNQATIHRFISTSNFCSVLGHDPTYADMQGCKCGVSRIVAVVCAYIMAMCLLLA